MTTRNPTPRNPTRRPDQVDTDGNPLRYATPMQREQLLRDLHDLPELVDHMHDNYWWFVAQGSSNVDDRNERYVINPDPVDLHDIRLKNRGIHADPIGEADLASRIGAQRAGVLPLLAGWVDQIAAEMRGRHQPHTAPARPHTVTSAAGWLSRHLDPIVEQPYVYELRHQVRDLVVALERLVGPAYAPPDHQTVETADELAARFGIEPGTIRAWEARGLLAPAIDPATGHVMRRSTFNPTTGRYSRSRLYFTREARTVHQTRKGRP